MGPIELNVLLPQGQDNTSIRYRGGEGTPAPTPAPGPAQGPDSTTTTTTQPQSPGTAGADPYAGCYSQLPMFAAIGLIFYFLLIRPQQKQEKARREMLRKMERGDRVVTNSGIHGVVAGIADDTVQIKVDSEGKVKITLDRSAIGRILTDDAAAKPAPAAKEVAKE